ncbi:MAG: DUF3300 domain-containing protein [Nitrospirae bacterium]|nr:MAG: DUF3300 domain-containing protein [Nitrospirota bacterium]
MLRLAAAILVLLLSPLPAHAELWRCPQANGPDVFTDQATDPRTCQKYESGTDISVVPSSSTTALPDAAPPGRPAFAQQELDQMLAPIALYPDSLLSQILMAATYPLEVVEAARWSKANPNLTGEQAVQAVAQNSWDPSVKSLVAFPQVLAMMDEHLDWMHRLGDAFLSQQAQVMDAVQGLRQKAFAAGNLATTDQVRVDQQGQTIVVESPNPQVIYVPYYDPRVIYGPWWWSAYPPVYWTPWPGYFVRPGFAVGFTWGLGIPVGERFFFGAFDWPHRHVNVINVTNVYYRPAGVTALNVWAHDPVHRRGVFYRDESMRQQFRRISPSPEARREFRGHEPSLFESRGGAPGRFAAPDVGRSAPHVIPGRPSVPGGGGPAHVEQRPHAFEGVGQGAAVRNFSERGHASAPGSAPHPSSSGGGHGGGGGGKSRH